LDFAAGGMGILLKPFGYRMYINRLGQHYQEGKSKNNVHRQLFQFVPGIPHP